MNRYSKLETASLLEDDEDIFESQALIENMDQSSNGIRFRQSTSKSKIVKSNESSTINGSNIELTDVCEPNGRAREPKESIDFTYYTVQPHDSLQSICLRYSCSINQVKRINGFISDQDFYGLNRIKLPVGKFGILGEILQQQDGTTTSTGGQIQNSLGRVNRQAFINSPGSAISTKPNSFRPLLDPFDSDEVKLPLKVGSLRVNASDEFIDRLQPSGSSFGSLMEMRETETNLEMSKATPASVDGVTDQIQHHKFIKTEIEDKVDIDDLIIMGRDIKDKVFQDLDYYVEKVKMSARNYEQRGAELVERINDTNIQDNQPVIRQVSKVPQLLSCNENFGLNFKRLMALIFVICVLVPLVWINQT